MSEKKVLKEGANKVTVVGTLVEKNLKIDTFKNTDGETIEFINGTISIRTGDNEVHQIRLRSNKYTKEGKENNLFKAYVTVQEEYVSVADVAEAAKKGFNLVASEVSVDGKLVTNEYYAQDGRLRQYQQIDGRFVNRLREVDDPTPRAVFEVDIFVSKARQEILDDEETGRAIVEAFIPTYSSIVPYNFAVIEEGADFFLYNLEHGQTLKVYGNILNVKKEQRKMVEMAFGEPREELVITYRSESLINNAKSAYEEDSPYAFNLELIKERLVKRQAYLEQQKARQNGENASTNNNSTGFPTNKSSDEVRDVRKLF
ncbi:hypothetical protein NSQ62_08290 [Solibacillus sp. FSL H8-0523]|uniref:hypothetical protein n=1 Tax=Solibacillus sp. FSL H8-0523 TaxID=2954511 RepID=UPI003101568C